MSDADSNPPAAVSASAGASALDQLPAYARSLLKVTVPVTAVLAEAKQRVDEVTELGPGSILQFDKSCEEMLELHADGLLIARGEAVKVGDKFGLRIRTVTLPDERFRPVRPL